MHADVARHGGSNDEDIGFFWTSIAGPARGGDPLGLPFVEIGASALNKADIPFPDGLVGAARYRGEWTRGLSSAADSDDQATHYRAIGSGPFRNLRVRDRIGSVACAGRNEDGRCAGCT